MESLTNNNLHVFKTYQRPHLGQSHEAELIALFANFCFKKYQSESTDLIPRYKNAGEVPVTTELEVNEAESLKTTILRIQTPELLHIVAFLESQSHFIALVKSSTPVFLALCLETLSLDPPLILQQKKLSPSHQVSLMNSLRPLAEQETSNFGEVELTFSPGLSLHKDSLKHIIVSVPKDDFSRIIKKDSSAPLDAIYKWLSKATTLHFENVDLRSFKCNYMASNPDGIKLSSDFAQESIAASILPAIVHVFV